MHKSCKNYTSVEVYRRLRYLHMEEKYYNHHFNKLKRKYTSPQTDNGERGLCFCAAHSYSRAKLPEI